MNQHTIYLPIVSSGYSSLKELFGSYNIQFGFSVGSSSFENKITLQKIIDHAAIVTTENALKMEVIQPQRGTFDFSEGDSIAYYAQDLGIDVHGHTASWHMQNPDWLVYGGFTRDELDTILREHVAWLTYKFRNKMVTFDTANEAYISPDGGVYGGPWQPLGEDYVTISFKCALAKTPPMYNSFFPHPDQEYPKALDLLDKGWADGIGIQLHLWDGSYKTTLASTETFLEQIQKRKSWCRFSEISVLANNNQSQATVYAAITRLAIKYQDVVRGFIVWGIIPPMWRGDVGIFDRYGQPKPAYYAVVEELKKED